jgi:hypothetical protein
VIKKRGLAIAAAAVLLLTSSCSLNRPPVITSLEAEEPGWTVPSDSLQVTCDAEDPEGDELSYNWSASGGNITSTGPEAIWTAPAEVGMYDITVVVSDSQGREATGLIALIASNGPPPIIEDLIVTAIGHPYLKETTTGYKVAKTYDYEIECIASGTGELIYEWSCTGGNISGEGSLITWTAPDTEGDITVTVKVFDGLDNWVRKSIAFEVVPCKDCEFW